MNRLPCVAVTMGAPSGVGPEVIAKALALPELMERCIPLVLGDRNVLEKICRELSLPVEWNLVEDPEEARPGHANLMNLTNVDMSRFHWGLQSAELSYASTFYIYKAIQIRERVDALVTAPIHKRMLAEAGFPYPGHSEMLVSETMTKQSIMLQIGERLKVAHVTNHYPLKDVAGKLSVERIAGAIRLAYQAMRELFDLRSPRVGVAGLNPHAGEGGLFGTEDLELITPAVLSAQEQGFPSEGPISADVLFHRALGGEFDVVVAMYHDQGYVPFRLIDFQKGVNLQYGLPIIRTSVDHGTAYDIAGKGLASEESMVRSILFAAELAARKPA